MSGATNSPEPTQGIEGTCRRPTGRHEKSLTLNDIQERAFGKWLAAGKPKGDCGRFWLDAEAELTQGRQTAAK